MTKIAKDAIGLGSRRIVFVLGAAVVIAIMAYCILEGNTPLPIGEYVAEQSSEKMKVEEDNVRIIRGKSTLYELPNRTNNRIYDKDDLVKSKPQRLNLIEEGKVEWIREPAGPNPQYKVIFIRRVKK